MKKTFLQGGFATACLFSLVLVSCGDASEKTDETAGDTAAASTPATDTSHAAHMDTANVPLQTSAKVDLTASFPDTAVTGGAKFTADAAGKVKLELDITIPAKAGKNVAVHFHEHGDCGDKGMASHGHWNPTKEDHGKWGTAPFHRGDIGNVKLDAKGKGTLTVETDLWTLGGAADKNILGKALIVHGGTDDYKTQPTGNAGSRIACGVVQ